MLFCFKFYIYSILYLRISIGVLTFINKDSVEVVRRLEFGSLDNTL